jgi:hypothetical protein
MQTTPGLLIEVNTGQGRNCTSNVGAFCGAMRSRPARMLRFSRWPWSSGTLQTSASLDKTPAARLREAGCPAISGICRWSRTSGNGSAHPHRPDLGPHVPVLHHQHRAAPSLHAYESPVVPHGASSTNACRPPCSSATAPCVHRAPSGHRWSGRSDNRHPCRPGRRREPNRARNGATPCRTRIHVQGL